MSEERIAELEATRDAARSNFLTMQGTAAKLLEDANDYKAAMTANLSRALKAEAEIERQSNAIRELREAVIVLSAGSWEGDHLNESRVRSDDLQNLCEKALLQSSKQAAEA